MRIVFIVRYLSDGGAERVTSLLSNGMAAAGHEITVISFRRVEEEYQLDDQVRLVYVPEGSFLSRAKLLRDLVGFFAPDCVISLGSKYDLMWAAGLFGKGRVILSERNDPGRKQPVLKRAFTWLCYHRAWGVVFQTPYASDYFKRGIQHRAVIANPAPTGLPSWDAKRHDKTVINCCRLIEQKNLSLLLRAFAVFYKTHPNYQLAIYGDGNLSDRLQELASELGIRDVFKLNPYSAEVHYYVAQSAMFVSSSDFEGISNSIIEALCMGVPTISTDSHGGGSRMLLEDGDCGVLVPCGDVCALAAAMSRIADDEEYAQELSRQARERSQALSLESICSQWLSFVEGRKE